MIQISQVYGHSQVFLKYCRFGDRRNNGRLQMAKLTALCKDAGITEAKKLPVQRVELGFSRLKPKVIESNVLSARGNLHYRRNIGQGKSEISSHASCCQAEPPDKD